MISSTDFQNAVQQLDVQYVQKLLDWIAGEKVNLDHFIADPTNHADYNPFAIFDFPALQQRSDMLGQVVSALQGLVDAKNNPDATVTMMVAHVNDIPYEIFPRLAGWAQQIYDTMTAQNALPLSDYSAFFTINVGAYEEELQSLMNVIAQTNTIIQYKIENNMP